MRSLDRFEGMPSVMSAAAELAVIRAPGCPWWPRWPRPSGQRTPWSSPRWCRPPGRCASPVTGGCSWHLPAGRVLRADGSLAFSWNWSGFHESVDALLGLAIDEVSQQATRASMDPAFHLSNGWVLEVFSGSSWDSWLLRLPAAPFHGAPDVPGQPGMTT